MVGRVISRRGLWPSWFQARASSRSRPCSSTATSASSIPDRRRRSRSIRSTSRAMGSCMGTCLACRPTPSRGTGRADRTTARRHGARQQRAEGPGAGICGAHFTRPHAHASGGQAREARSGHGGDGRGQDRRAGSSATSLAAGEIQAGIAAGAIKSRLPQAGALRGVFPREVSARSRMDTHAGAAGNMLRRAWTSRSQRKRRTSTPRSDRSSDGSRFRIPASTCRTVPRHESRGPRPCGVGRR